MAIREPCQKDSFPTRIHHDTWILWTVHRIGGCRSSPWVVPASKCGTRLRRMRHSGAGLRSRWKFRFHLTASEPARRAEIKQLRKILIRTARSTSNPCYTSRRRMYPDYLSICLLTNALAHDSPLVPDARERPPTEHDMREHHTGQRLSLIHI